MIEVARIQTFEDRAFQRAMVRSSTAVVAAGAVLGALWFATGMPRLLGLPGSEMGAVLFGDAGPHLLGLPAVFCWFLVGLAGCFASLAVHELVHGVLFKLLAPAGAHVTFGANWKAGMLYACADGIVYTRRQYLAVAFGPTVVVTAIALAIGVATGWPVVWYAVAVLHLSGCTGDWGYVRAIVRNPSIAYCEDTDWGVRFFAEDDAEDGAGADGEDADAADVRSAPGDRATGTHRAHVKEDEHL